MTATPQGENRYTETPSQKPVCIILSLHKCLLITSRYWELCIRRSIFSRLAHCAINGLPYGHWGGAPVGWSAALRNTFGRSVVFLRRCSIDVGVTLWLTGIPLRGVWRCLNFANQEWKHDTCQVLAGVGNNRGGFGQGRWRVRDNRSSLVQEQRPNQ